MKQELRENKGNLLNYLYLSSKLAKHWKESNLPSFSHKIEFLYYEVTYSNQFQTNYYSHFLYL